MKKIVLNILLTFIFYPMYSQTGPAGIGDTLGNSNLIIWFKADAKNKLHNSDEDISEGKKINSWVDCSGNNFTATATSTVSQPYFTYCNELNNQPALRFIRNDNSNYIRTGLFTNSSYAFNDATFIIVYLPVSVSGGDDISGSNAPQSSWYYGAGIFDGEMNGIQNDFGIGYTGNSIAYGEGNPLISSDITIKKPSPLSVANIVMCNRDASLNQIELITQLKDSVSFSKNINVRNSPNRFSIGSTNGNTPFDGNYFDGFIAEIIAYNKKLSLSESIIIHNYLAAKYNITTIAYDYYTMDNPMNGDFDHHVIGIGKDAFSSTLNSKGSGFIQISNPSNLESDEYFFIGQNNFEEPTITKNQIPSIAQSMLQSTWGISTKGDIGTIDLTLTTTAFNSTDANNIYLVIDSNNNHSFADEKITSFITSATYIGNNQYLFKNLDLKNEQKFTFVHSYSNVANDEPLNFTPNGDGNNDVFVIKENEMIKIYDRYGNLIKKMQGPNVWDGTDQSGVPVGTGFYLIQIGDSKHLNLTLIK